MISASTTSHFCPISSQDFANWLRINLPDKLWSVDGEERLSGYLDFPCSTEDLASAFDKMNQVVQVQAPETVKQLDVDTLDKAILYFPISPGDPNHFMSFYLCWQQQGPEDAWVLSEDLIEDK